MTQFLALKPADDRAPADPERRRRRWPRRPGDGHRRAVATHVVGTVALNPLADRRLQVGRQHAGARAARRTGVRQRRPGAFPNLLESIVIRGNIAYVPGTCSSPNGPFRFNVNVQSCLSDDRHRRSDAEAFKTLNMNVGVNFEPAGETGCSTPTRSRSPSSARRAEGFVALGATNRLLRVTLDGAGPPDHQPAGRRHRSGQHQSGSSSRIRERNRPGRPDDDTIGGKNPRGLVLNSTDTRAYVMDFLSRDIAVVDISGDDPTLYHDACADCRRPTCRRPAPIEAIVAARQVAVQHRDRAGGHGRQLQASGRTDVGLRLGHLLQLPPAAALTDTRDLDVRRRSAPGHLDGEHLRVRRRR